MECKDSSTRKTSPFNAFEIVFSILKKVENLKWVFSLKFENSFWSTVNPEQIIVFALHDRSLEQ